MFDDQPDCGSLDRPPDAVQIDKIDGVEGCEGAYPGAAAAPAPQFAIADQRLNGCAYGRPRGAAAGEILVSQTVKDLVTGSGITFEDRGLVELKGLPGQWRLYSVAR